MMSENYKEKQQEAKKRAKQRKVFWNSSRLGTYKESEEIMRKARLEAIMKVKEDKNEKKN